MTNPIAERTRGCPICGDIRRDHDESGIARAYGNTTADTARFYSEREAVLFVPVSPLVRGYVLLASRHHTDRPMLHHGEPETWDIVHRIIHSLSQVYGSGWFFEHVSPSPTGTSCVPHSHVHCLPGSPPPSLFHSAEVTSPEDPQIDVILGGPRNSVGLIVHARLRQHVRRHIALHEHHLPVWDWRLHRHTDAYSSTSEDFPQIAYGIPGMVPLSAPVLVLAGASGSGKSTIGRIISSHRKVPIIEIGDIVRARHRAARSSLPLVDFAQQQFDEHGVATFVEQAAREFEDSGGCVLVGPRRLEEVQYIQGRSECLVAWLEAPPDVRATRKMSETDHHHFRRRDAIEHAWGMGQIRDIADLIADNTERGITCMAKEIEERWLRHSPAH